MIAFLLKGGTLMVPLFVCSILAVAVIVERGFFWFKASDDSISERVLRAAKDNLSGNTKSAIDGAIVAEQSQMKRYMSILDTIITIAPLLGILGTVIGIIFSFDVLGQEGVQDPKLVSAGIGQALITTAAGLSIAIFTVVPYNFFLHRIEKTTSEIEASLSKLECETGKSLL